MTDAAEALTGEAVTGGIIERALGVFTRAAGAPVDPPTLVPADLAIELSGETIRPRLCIFSTPERGDVALRPDVTLPLVLARIEESANGAPARNRFSYAGRAWRIPQPPETRIEYQQIGFEIFGEPRSDETDTGALLLTLDAVEQAGLAAPRVQIGDASLLPDVLAALDLHPAWRATLSHRIAEGSSIADLMALTHGPLSPPAPGFADIAAIEDEAEAVATLEARLARQGTDIFGHRPLASVVARLREKREVSAIGPLSEAARGVLSAVLALPAEPGAAADAMQALAAERANAALLDIAARLRARFEALLAARADLAGRTRFSAYFGQRFAYYDGFLFAISAQKAPAGSNQPVASGGRYDTLLATLSQGRVNETAIGGMLRTERIAAALAAQEGAP